MSGGTPDTPMGWREILDEAAFQMVRHLELRFSGAEIDLNERDDAQDVKSVVREVVLAALHQERKRIATQLESEASEAKRLAIHYRQTAPEVTKRLDTQAVVLLRRAAAIRQGDDDAS